MGGSAISLVSFVTNLTTFCQCSSWLNSNLPHSRAARQSNGIQMCNLISLWTMGTTADRTEWKWWETLFWVDVDPTLSVCIQGWGFWRLRLDKLTTSYSPVPFEVFQSEVAQWGVMTSSVVFNNTNGRWASHSLISHRLLRVWQRGSSIRMWGELFKSLFRSSPGDPCEESMPNLRIV